MMETIALIIVVIALCGLIGWIDYNNRRERKHLVNALMAKNSAELRDLDFVDQVGPTLKTEPTTTSNLVPVDQLSDEEFEEQILNG